MLCFSVAVKKITVSVTRYDEPNWLLWQALESLSRQERVEAEVLVLDQIFDNETQHLTTRLSNPNIQFKYINIPKKSLSFARNYTLRNASHDMILFIDCDAIAEVNWAFHLSESLSEKGVAIVAGRILPQWHKKPLLISKSRVVREQYSLLDLGESEIEAYKVVGAGFGLNRKLLGVEAYFDENLGRQKGMLLGGEETDLCERALRSGLSIRYNPYAVVHHQVLPERISYRWILKRIYCAGVSRALRGGRPSPTHAVGLWDFLVGPIILPWYVTGYVRGRFFGI